MRRFLSPIILLLLFAGNITLAQKEDSLVLRKIFTEAISDTTAYHNLRYLCTRIGGRLCGSPQAEKAVKWSKTTLEAMGLDTVWLQECRVRHWVRGNTEELAAGRGTSAAARLHACAIGGSVGTGKAGLRAKVVEVADFDGLKALGRKNIEGRIVFFNHPPDPAHYNTFGSYGELVRYRVAGANYASAYGAIGVIVRSATVAHDDFPHTGILHYADTVKKIPAMALSANAAERLAGLLKATPGLELFMNLSSTEYPETTSYNVIGEIRGAVHPERIIAFGGHIDSWDTGQGAHDDGTGIMQAVDVLRIFKTLNLKPACTIRVVLFMDEEMSQRGAKKYGEYAKAQEELYKSQLASGSTGAPSGEARQPHSGTHHVAAIETDRGGFTPFGFSIEATDDQIVKIRGWKELLLPYGLYSFEKGGSGVDIRELKSLGVPLLDLVPDSQRYFDYHHSARDLFANVNPRELQLGTFSIAAMVYLIDKYGL
ncbi:MAG: M20/M25/M40 family metallo-hydrolase [Bacteroidota bacterium]